MGRGDVVKKARRKLFFLPLFLSFFYTHTLKRERGRGNNGERQAHDGIEGSFTYTISVTNDRK